MDPLEKQIMELRNAIALQEQRLNRYELDMARFQKTLDKLSDAVQALKESNKEIAIKMGLVVAFIVSAANFVAPWLLNR
jgi:uncharacterized protein (DUF3084 family)